MFPLQKFLNLLVFPVVDKQENIDTKHNVSETMFLMRRIDNKKQQGKSLGMRAVLYMLL